MNNQYNFQLLTTDNRLFKVLFQYSKIRPKLADFLIVENKDILLLTRVEEENYFLEYNELKDKVLRIKELGLEYIGQLEKEDLNKLVYSLLPLAILDKKTRKLNPSYRNIPLHLETVIRLPSFEELIYFFNYEYLKENYKDFDNFEEYLNSKNINEGNIKKKEKELLFIFNGEIIGYFNNKIPVIFNINKFLAKRTGVFARTGYGKSNAVKTLILKILKLHFTKTKEELEKENNLIIVYDVNGEYAFSNEQNLGFSELFKNNPENFLVLTNKRFSYDFVKPLKLNFAELSLPEITDLLMEAFRGEEIKAYTYFEEIRKEWITELFQKAIEKEKSRSGKDIKDFDKNNIRNINSFVINYLRDILYYVSSSLKIDLNNKYDEEKELELKKGKKVNIISVINELKKEIINNPDMQEKLRNSSLKDVNVNALEWRLKKLLDNLFHPKGISSRDIMEWYDNKNLVIIDLSSTDDWAGNLISTFISKKIFEYSQEKFLENNKRYNVITVFEEAQNLLDDITKNNNIYVRLAKEGRKFNISLFAITQQPSSISPKILSQMDNYLAFHLLNDDDINSLSKANSHYSGLIKYLMKYEPIKGQCFFYSSPEQPFIIQLQFNLFDEEFNELKEVIKNFLNRKNKELEDILENSVF